MKDTLVGLLIEEFSKLEIKEVNISLSKEEAEAIYDKTTLLTPAHYIKEVVTKEDLDNYAFSQFFMSYIETDRPKAIERFNRFKDIDQNDPYSLKVTSLVYLITLKVFEKLGASEVKTIETLGYYHPSHENTGKTSRSCSTYLRWNGDSGIINRYKKTDIDTIDLQELSFRDKTDIDNISTIRTGNTIQINDPLKKIIYESTQPPIEHSRTPSLINNYINQNISISSSFCNTLSYSYTLIDTTVLGFRVIALSTYNDCIFMIQNKPGIKLIKEYIKEAAGEYLEEIGLSKPEKTVGVGTNKCVVYTLSLCKVAGLKINSVEFNQKDTFKLEPEDFIDKFYADDFKVVHESIVNNVKENMPSLYLLHGLPGTGKTAYLEYLPKMFNYETKRFFLVSHEMLNFIASVDNLDKLSILKNSVLVIEEVDSFIKSNGSTEVRNGLLSKVLALTDGVLAKYLNCTIIMTFNTELKNIDKALLRKGRLTKKYEFDKLPLNKTNNLLKELGFEESNKPLKIADIFNQEDNGEKESKGKSVGF